jgi:hypothetical protein
MLVTRQRWRELRPKAQPVGHYGCRDTAMLVYGGKHDVVVTRPAMTAAQYIPMNSRFDHRFD